ncbi:hypothetical protein [Pseudoalteromonas byunsanensis]|uniref:Uncharacterized protein n=1 Tax=Pseudoalteromonas byunsanensis TaxID=327939 RepID=A0A1S1N7P8_9GAMM|nr:hypothetical protein [Pseudoalteromonas byunsanensis]OHU95512.1 hypothetical protein BIW53_09780 [Pseudoalteromonas byunsanensis]
MFYIKWCLKAIFCITALLALFWLFSNFYNWVNSAKPLVTTQGTETRSKVHWLNETKPLVYTFSATRTDSIRILSNAILGLNQAHDQPVHYAIAYSLLDEQQRIIHRATYHHTARVTHDETHQKAKQIIEQRESLSVSSGQSFYINNAHFSDATAISLSLQSEDPSIKGVVVRVHAKTSASIGDNTNAWLKYPLAWRARISSYHTLGPNALSDEEIANAVRYDWRKLAPQGVPGVDFDNDTLYEMLPYSVIGYDFSAKQVNQDAFYTDDELSASLKVDALQDIYFISEQAAELHLTWYDLEGFLPPHVLRPDHTATANLYKLAKVKPGLISVSSNLPVISQWYYHDKQPIGALHSFYYQIDNDSDVRYSVVPDSDVKLDFRTIQISQVKVKLYSEKGAELNQFSITIHPELSQFDRIILADTSRSRVSDSQTWYLRDLPKNVAYLRVFSDKKVLIKLQTRQANFNYQNTVCEPVCNANSEPFVEIPAWYALKADNDHALTSQGKASKVRLFLPPPASKNKESFYYSRDLTTVLPVSNTALINAPAPYYRTKAEPQTFQFKKLDDNNAFKQLQKSLTADHTLIVQHSRPPYIHELKTNLVSATEAANQQNVTLYINHGPNRPWTKQRLFLLNANKNLTLSYEELPLSVVIKVYTASQTARPVELAYQLKGKFDNQPVASYSITNKHLQLHPSTYTQAFMLHPTIGKLTPYPSVTVPINDDIHQLEHLLINSSSDIWISIVDEYTQKPKRLNWWLDEDI